MHDLGVIAETRVVDGQEKRGLRLVVGGGLGSVPYQAKLFDEFLAPEELLPITQAIARVFGRLGERRTATALESSSWYMSWGSTKFKDLVMEERKILPHDSRWTGIRRGCDQGI